MRESGVQLSTQTRQHLLKTPVTRRDRLLKMDGLSRLPRNGHPWSIDHTAQDLLIELRDYLRAPTRKPAPI